MSTMICSHSLIGGPRDAARYRIGNAATDGAAVRSARITRVRQLAHLMLEALAQRGDLGLVVDTVQACRHVDLESEEQVFELLQGLD